MNFTFSQTWTARYTQVIGITEKFVEFAPPIITPGAPEKFEFAPSSSKKKVRIGQW